MAVAGRILYVPVRACAMRLDLLGPIALLLDARRNVPVTHLT